MDERIEQDGAGRGAACGESPVWLRSGEPPPSLAEALEVLRAVFEHGARGHRDQEPHSDAFDRLLERWTPRTARCCWPTRRTPTIWRTCGASSRFRLSSFSG